MTPRKPPLTVEEARRRGVCRICQVNNLPGPDNPFVLDLGKEYAHQQCLDNAQRIAELAAESLCDGKDNL